MPPVVLCELLHQWERSSRPLRSSKQLGFKAKQCPGFRVIAARFLNDSQRTLVIVSIMRGVSQVEHSSPSAGKVLPFFCTGHAGGIVHLFSFGRLALRREYRAEVITSHQVTRVDLEHFS